MDPKLPYPYVELRRRMEIVNNMKSAVLVQYIEKLEKQLSDDALRYGQHTPPSIFD